MGLEEANDEGNMTKRAWMFSPEGGLGEVGFKKEGKLKKKKKRWLDYLTDLKGFSSC